MTRLTFLGTGNFSAPDRYWNSFVVDDDVLVEPCPTALPHLRKCGFDVTALDVVLISHFHPDHTFGWPFLLLEFVQRGRGRPLTIVGPPGVQRFLADMMELGGVPDLHEQAHDLLDVRYLEVDGSWQDAGNVRVRGVEVEHVPHLRCYGFLVERSGGIIGYSGDVHPCAGLDELAAGADVLVLECNGPHPDPPAHMRVEDVAALRERFPDVPFVLTHLGPNVGAPAIADVVIPDDFETLEV